MMKLRGCWVALLLLPTLLHAENDDKSVLFNTFYLDGEKPSYVLTITPDKKFELFGPDNEHIEGTVRASGEHVTLTAGNVKRMFHYDSSGMDVKLGRREGDRPVPGNLLGEMPPIDDAVFRTHYIAEANWIKKGRPAFRRDGQPVGKGPKRGEAAPATAVAAEAEPPAPVSAPADAPVAPVGHFADLAGTYTLKNVGGNDDTLVIQPAGQFEYTRGDGMKQAGTLLRADDELTFLGGGLRRRFSVKIVPSGIELERRETDVLKPGEVLGAMPPQERTALTWLKKAGAPPAPPAPTQEASNTPPAAAPETAPTPAIPPPPTATLDTTPPAPPHEATATEAEKGAVVEELKQIAGSFTHRPSPFISETLAIAEDGSFTYKDSNGASASGTVKVESKVLTFTSGEVVRSFTGVLEADALALRRTAADSPKFKNDLASMSPTVLKEAKYEKK